MSRPRKIDAQRDAAAAVLTEAGEPLPQSRAARLAGIPVGSVSNVFRHPRFTILPDKRVTLVDPAKLPPKKPAPPREKRKGEPSVAELKAVLRRHGPLKLAEISDLVNRFQTACYRALESRSFERDEHGLYWLTLRKQPAKRGELVEVEGDVVEGREPPKGPNSRIGGRPAAVQLGGYGQCDCVWQSQRWN